MRRPLRLNSISTITALRPLEDAILAELEPLRQCGARVAELIGQGSLLEQANADVLS
jgi:hypothetical protein